MPKANKFLTVEELSEYIRSSKGYVHNKWPEWRDRGVEIIRLSGGKGKLLINRRDFEEIILKGARV